MQTLVQARTKAASSSARSARVHADRIGSVLGPLPRGSEDSRAVELLRETSTRVTVGRIAIMDLLLRRKDPLSAAEVREALGVRAPDRVTIYRSLEALAERGLIGVVVATDRIRRYVIRRASGEARVRFKCSVCKRITVLPVVLPELPALSDCSIERQTLSVAGVCSACL